LITNSNNKNTDTFEPPKGFLVSVLKHNNNRNTDTFEPPKGFLVSVLKPCALAIAKSCALIWSEMRKGQVYEEEDFMTNKFGVSMYEDIPTAMLIAMLDQAEYWMESEGTQWIQTHCGDEAGNVLKGVMERIDYCRVRISALSTIAGKRNPSRHELFHHTSCFNAQKLTPGQLISPLISLYFK